MTAVSVGNRAVVWKGFTLAGTGAIQEQKVVSQVLVWQQGP